MMNYILDELMPWHRQIYDLSQLEVNQRVMWDSMVLVLINFSYVIADQSKVSGDLAGKLL